MGNRKSLLYLAACLCKKDSEGSAKLYYMFVTIGIVGEYSILYDKTFHLA